MKKHTPEEILALLGQANELSKRGLSQAEVCQTLGISVMTYHRWRKMPLLDSYTVTGSTGDQDKSVNNLQHLHELRLEDLQLRKLVPDLMLENLRLQTLHRFFPLKSTTDRKRP